MLTCTSRATFDVIPPCVNCVQANLGIGSSVIYMFHIPAIVSLLYSNHQYT